MSKTIENLEKAIYNQHEHPTKLKTAYDYLNRLYFAINDTCNKSVELLVGDAVYLVGNSMIINLMLTKIVTQALMPKKYGGFRGDSKVFILDAGNCTDVYQFVDFMKQYGLDIKKSLSKIMISRVFTVYQLTHFLKYELLKIIHKNRTDVVMIPDLLAMFTKEPDINHREIEFLLRDIRGLLKEVSSKHKVLLITSISLTHNKLSPKVIVLRNKLLGMFNKCIKVDMNKTNDKFKVLIQEKHDVDYITIKKYLYISSQDILTVTSR